MYSNCQSFVSRADSDFAIRNDAKKMRRNGDARSERCLMVGADDDTYTVR